MAWFSFKKIKEVIPYEPTPVELAVDFIFALLKEDPDGWNCASDQIWRYPKKGIQIYIGNSHRSDYHYVTIDIPKFKWSHEDIPEKLRAKVWTKFSNDPDAIKERAAFDALEQLIKVQ